MNQPEEEKVQEESVRRRRPFISARTILKNRREEEYEKFEEEFLPQTIFGIRFPWEAWFFVIVGALSEVVDALFMNETLDKLTGLDSVISITISAIVGAGCFFSMAFAGFQLANRRYYSKIGIGFSYGFWAIAGVALVTAKLLAGMSDGGLDEVLAGNMAAGEMFGSSDFLGQAIVAVVQLVLYVGTGFMTRDSVRILTDNDIREYQLAKREYDDLLDELAEKRRDIMEDVSKLKSYPKIAKRLIRSKKSVKHNVQQYNEAARAIIEAKMSISVQPELMEEMYDSAMAKEEKNRINSMQRSPLGKIVVAVVIGSVVSAALGGMSAVYIEHKKADDESKYYDSSNANDNDYSGYARHDYDGVYKVVEVIDGDTFSVQYGDSVERVRLIGVDTPETVDSRVDVQCYGPEASDYLKKMLTNKEVELSKDSTQGNLDSYGRLLRYVSLDGKDIGLDLISNGYAKEYTYETEYLYKYLYNAAQEAAKSNKLGLWSDKCKYNDNNSESTSNNTAPEANNVTPESSSNTADCLIKGNINSKGEKIYHVPGQQYYNDTKIEENKGERWFCTEAEAIAAGWRKSKV